MKYSVLITILYTQCLLLAASCDNDAGQKKQKTYSREELIQMNRENLNKETALIQAFIERNNMTMQESLTGLRYNIYHNDTGATARTDQVVTVNYRGYLLDSSLVADTKTEGPLTFKIGHSNVVSGLHEAVQLMSVGDSARFILPSHLAYGLTGDVNIPGNSPILYDVELHDIK